MANVEVEVVTELTDSPSGASQVLVKADGDYFVVSSVNALYTGFETLVFRANAKGDVTDWIDVAGGRGMSRAQAIADLKDVLEREWADADG